MVLGETGVQDSRCEVAINGGYVLNNKWRKEKEADFTEGSVYCPSGWDEPGRKWGLKLTKFPCRSQLVSEHWTTCTLRVK